MKNISFFQGNVLGITTDFKVENEPTPEGYRMTLSCVMPRVQYDAKGGFLVVMPPDEETLKKGSMYLTQGNLEKLEDDS